MDYKEKVIALLNSQELSKEQKEKLEEIFPELAESDDEAIRKAIINVFATHKDYEVFFGVSVENILAWLKKQGEKKFGWSEYDEIALNRIIPTLESLKVKVKAPAYLLQDIVWLKSLKDRIQPQQRQEWSEEEIEKAAQEWDSKANFNPFYMIMDGGKPTDVKQDITTHKESFKAGVNWILKSLRPQSQ
jgi:hypothetical protein